MPDPGTHPAYAALQELLRERIGLDPASAAAGGLPAALAALGIDGSDALAGYLASAQRQPERLDALVQRIVVHETWFYREPAAFEVLASAARSTVGLGGRPYRVLSLPCSTGEEAYSVAIALQGLPAQIVAIDVSAAAVARAREARFGHLSFRGRSAEWRAANFDVDGRHWRPKHGLGAAIRFEVGNLLSLPGELGAEPFDAVFCRNLLIYLDAPARTRAYATLRRLARPDSGLIFVGHAESAGAFDGQLQRVDHPMSFAFHNRAAPCRPVQGPAARRLTAPRPARPPAARPPSAPAVRAGVPADPLLAARALADRGELDAARRACAAVLQAHPTLADGHALLGVLVAAAGETDAAARHFAKALYLDPDHRDSLSHLLLIAEQAGDHAQAQRLRERLRRTVVAA